MNSDSFQIIVTILGILSQVILLVKDIPKGRANEPLTPTPPKAWQSPQRLLDLSFALLCSTFFSLLLMDSIVISGRAPSPGLDTTLTVLAITAVVFATMFAAWWLNKSEMVTGFLALTTLAVLIISPGGPFGDSPANAKDIQKGLTLYIPVLSLVILASTMMIYSWGSPISNTVSQGKRYAVSLALVALLIVGAGALGQHLVGQILRSEKTPKIESDAAKKLVHEISGWELQQRQTFYQLAAEITMAYQYQEANQQVKNLQQQIQLMLEPASTPQQNTTDNGLASSTGSYNKNNKKAESWLTRAGSDRIYILIEQFKAGRVPSQESYLRRRLDWVHPFGRGRAQSSLPLTGIKIEDRFETIGILRLFQTLEDAPPDLPQKLMEEFTNYDECIRQYYLPSSRSPLPAYPKEPQSVCKTAPPVIQEFLPGEKGIKYTLNLFPQSDSSDDVARLKMQLRLPLIVESSIAYSEYADLALQLVKDRTDPQYISSYDSISKEFNKLSSDSRNALRYYVASDPKSLNVLQNLVAMYSPEYNADFDPLAKGNSAATYTLKAALETYSKDGLPSSPPPNPLNKLAYDIVSKKIPDVTYTVRTLLDKEDSKIRLQPLFEKSVFEFAKKMREAAESTRQEFFSAIADPVGEVVYSMAKTIDIQQKGNGMQQKGDEGLFYSQLKIFGGLAHTDQNNLLHQLAISLYHPGGEFSLDPVRLLVIRAKAWKETAALICASIIMLPLLIISILSGSYFARKLVARDRMRELISKELKGYSEAFNTIGHPVELYGRDDVLRDLRSLAERGWSTIGVVGRRGVGKSRILSALSQSNVGQDEAPTVRVLVPSPSRFEEDDFIASLFERLAISTEGAIASFLGAKPLSVRRIENRMTHVSIWYYASAMSLFLIIMYQMYDRLTRAEIVITWLPIAALLLSSLFTLIYYISKLQPVDLSSWLQRDRAHNPHTVMLYREVNEALRFLRRRVRQLTSADSSRQRNSPILSLTMKVLLVVFFCTLAYALIAWGSESSLWEVVISLSIAAVTGGGWALLYQQSELSENRAASYSQSTMSLIAEYRLFARSIVYRLNQGALGPLAKRKFSVLICIDELDKIIDFGEIRDFLRRIKAIFEVPGVYYYVSLAEDTLTALYLGATTGKNEIDSSFDHIVRIQPLICEVGADLAARYLEKHGIERLPSRLARTIATLSYGIPRDIIRRCDEYIARAGVEKVNPRHLASELRRKQANLGYELHWLSSKQVDDLSCDSMNAALAAQRLLSNSFSDNNLEQQHRLILSLWLIALIEITIELPELPDNERWRKISDELCTLGYRLSIEGVSDLKPDIENLHISILT